MSAAIVGDKTGFFLRNFGKGLLWLVILIVAFVLIRQNVDISFKEKLEPFFENTSLILLIYSLSEILFGIFPPELFMLWALRTGNIVDYSLYILLFATISYIAGFIGYLFGAYLQTTIYFRYARKRFLGKYHSLLQKYGVFLILVAALTPLPFSAISMLVGSLHYPMRRYLLWALSRFLRYAVYAIIIWEVGLF
ncbi:MAG TPA: VTT domain-containing protein [Bacteroidales bacterium]|nr:VTT domain-containing protein [Bacteroidales bacterium]HRX95764.1 VTT domain-containing protein [Bacteroidales bacterium]